MLAGGSEELARQLAMHISFAAPEWLAKEDVPASRRGREAGLSQLRRARGQARAGEGEDRRGHARQALLRGAAGWRADRAALDPRRAKTVGQALSTPERVSGVQALLPSQNSMPRQATTLFPTVAELRHASSSVASIPTDMDAPCVLAWRALARREQGSVALGGIGDHPRGTGGAGASGAAPTFRRVLLKLSGEALMGDHDYGTDPKTVEGIAREIVDVQAEGSSWRSSSAAATSTAASPPRPRGWTAPPPTTPACSRSS